MLPGCTTRNANYEQVYFNANVPVYVQLVYVYTSVKNMYVCTTCICEGIVST